MKKNNSVLYITVLDFEEGRVYQYISTGEEDREDFITNMGHNLTNCEWMEHSNPIVKCGYSGMEFGKPTIVITK